MKIFKIQISYIKKIYPFKQYENIFYMLEKNA